MGASILRLAKRDVRISGGAALLSIYALPLPAGDPDLSLREPQD
jgi:hypothetical protein